jgi:hypothetical protein
MLKDLIEETIWTLGLSGGMGVAIWAIVSMIALM